MKKILLDDNVVELHKTISFDTPENAYIQIVEALRAFWEEGADVVSAEVFAPRTYLEVIAPLANASFPVNWVCSLEDDFKPVLAGAHFVGISGTKPKFVKTQRGIKAVVYEDSANIYCRTFGVYSPLGNDDAYAHTRSNLEMLEETLRECDFKFTDIVRTWFYNEDILSWYSDFNKARTEFYTKQGIFNGLLPASTGIGAPNPASKKIVSGLLAMKSKPGKIAGASDFVSEALSPLQGGAPEYGSSFSRAIEIISLKSRRVMISGTASIGADGKTLYEGDIFKQVDLTLRVIEGILKDKGLGFENTTNAIVYCLRPEYFKVFQDWNKSHNIPFCPSYSIVCRGDLLFEVELEAAVNV